MYRSTNNAPPTSRWLYQLSTGSREGVTKRNSYRVGGCGAHRAWPLHDAKRCLAANSTNEFAVRQITAEDVQTLTDVQTDAFFEPNPIAVLNGFFKSLFRAEVLDSMRVKMRSASEGSDAVILVATPKQASAHADESKPVAILELYIGNDKNIIDTIQQGAGVGHRPDKYAWLASMAVASDFRRQGCARVLLDAVHEKLYELECEWAVLSVYPGNYAAMGLYQSEGYTNCGTQGTAWLDFLGSKSTMLMLRPRDDLKGRIQSPL